jgi:hypothetical protein
MMLTFAVHGGASRSSLSLEGSQRPKTAKSSTLPSLRPAPDPPRGHRKNLQQTERLLSPPRTRTLTPSPQSMSTPRTPSRKTSQFTPRSPLPSRANSLAFPSHPPRFGISYDPKHAMVVRRDGSSLLLDGHEFTSTPTVIDESGVK